VFCTEFGGEFHSALRGCLGRIKYLLALTSCFRCVFVVRVKSILGVSPKVKESIKNPFRWKIWLGGIRIGLHVRVKGMTTA
jgi:hypothetical protein